MSPAVDRRGQVVPLVSPSDPLVELYRRAQPSHSWSAEEAREHLDAARGDLRASHEPAEVTQLLERATELTVSRDTAMSDGELRALSADDLKALLVVSLERLEVGEATWLSERISEAEERRSGLVWALWVAGRAGYCREAFDAGKRDGSPHDIWRVIGMRPSRWCPEGVPSHLDTWVDALWGWVSDETGEVGDPGHYSPDPQLDGYGDLGRAVAEVELRIADLWRRMLRAAWMSGRAEYAQDRERRHAHRQLVLFLARRFRRRGGGRQAVEWLRRADIAANPGAPGPLVRDWVTPQREWRKRKTESVNGRVYWRGRGGQDKAYDAFRQWLRRARAEPRPSRRGRP